MNFPRCQSPIIFNVVVIDVVVVVVVVVAVVVGIHVGTRDHRSVGYRVPKEWAGLTREAREAGSLAAVKRRSRACFLAEYGGFECGVVGCGVCGGPWDLASQGGHVP